MSQVTFENALKWKIIPMKDTVTIKVIEHGAQKKNSKDLHYVCVFKLFS